MTKQAFQKHFGFLPDERLVLKNTIMCPKCISEPAIVDLVYGILKGKSCKSKSDTKGLGRPYEFTTEAIRKGREEYASDMIQSHRSGEFSREFAELYPEKTRGMIKAGVITREEVKKSKYVWRGDIHKSWERNKKLEADMV
jgi:hypothetical protein